MSDLSQRWAPVAEAVVRRMEELALSQADVVRLSGLSDPTVRGFMTGRLRGEPKRPNIHKLCKALGWQPSSIDDVLAGGAPTLLPDESPTQLDALRDRVAELGQMVGLLLDEARGRLGAESDFAARLAALEAARDQQPSL